MANLRIAELDFDGIKQNLKNFLQAQEEFSDYDFEGSGLSVLLDVLAYNTHYNAYLANMLVNESFLDSAVKRASAVSIAKHLGYVPRSLRGSRATVNITVNNPVGNPETITLDRYTPFTTTIDGTAYTFLNLAARTTSKVNDLYRFDNIEIVEGRQLEIEYVVTNPSPSEKFQIPNADVDTSTLLVTVQNSATDTTTTTYNLSTDITNVSSTSLIYYLEENPFEKYQIYFGDGVLGKKLEVGNIVRISYLVSTGAATNTSNTITQVFTTTSIAGSSNVIINTASNSDGGTPKEDITSIKFNAPKFYSSRNRAVTINDYEALVRNEYPELDSISVWGGEDNDPPVYGKVLISLKPKEGFVVSQLTKNNILQSLRSKRVLSIQPEFIDPEYFYVQMIFYVVYDSVSTSKSASNIENIVRNTIREYFRNDLQKFNSDFIKSKLTKLVLEADTSITSVLFDVRVQKRNFLVLNSNNSFTGSSKINLNNGIVPGTVASSRFFITNNNQQRLVRFVDVPRTMPPDPRGTGSLIIQDVGSGLAIISNAGTVNYQTGEVNVSGFTPTALPNNINDFRITSTIQLSEQNLVVDKNQILVLDETTSNAAAGREAGLTINVTAN